MSRDVVMRHGRTARGWIVAPTYDLSMEEWRIAETTLRDVIDWGRSSKHEKKIFFKHGSEVELKSADNKDTTLRGAGLDFAIMAEAARIPREAWEQGVRPALADKLGRAVISSTPKGRNWFYELYLQGLDPNQSEYKSWKLPSTSNPFFPSQEWETLKRTVPELVFKQEFEAEFLEDASSVFRKVRRQVQGTLEEPVVGNQYVMGVDLARLHDFTVIIIFDMYKKHLVFYDRFNQISWPFQKERIFHAAKKYNNALVWLDSSGLGDPIEHDLQRMGLRAFGYKFTNTSKEELIELISISIEQGFITYPEIPQLIQELESMAVELLPSGKFRYSAPQGYYDDSVMALGLALNGMKDKLYYKPVTPEVKPYDHLDERSKGFWERWDQNTQELKKGENPKPSEFLDGLT